MKKIVQGAAVLLVCFVISGCGKAEQAEKKQTQDTIQVKITLEEDHKNVDEKTIKVTKNEKLQKVMKENYTIKLSKGYISEIDGRKQDEKQGKYWLYEINGKQADVGANQYKLKKGDKIVWTLNPYEETK